MGLNTDRKSTAPFHGKMRPFDGTGRDNYTHTTLRDYVISDRKQYSDRPPKPVSHAVFPRTDPSPGYNPSGTGRDLYMCANGPVPATGKSAFSERPPAPSASPICARTDGMPRYKNDGTGRDVYLNMSKFPFTGKLQHSEKPPSPQRGAQHVRTDPLPQFLPSGSGRDMFHRVETSSPDKGWSLRDHQPSDQGAFYGKLGQPVSRPQSQDQKRKQKMLMDAQLDHAARMATAHHRTHSPEMNVSHGKKRLSDFLRSP